MNYRIWIVIGTTRNSFEYVLSFIRKYIFTKYIHPIPLYYPLVYKQQPAYIKEIEIKSIKTKEGLDITDSYVRSWIDLNTVPYKYEFRGEYVAYHNPNELIIVRR